MKTPPTLQSLSHLLSSLHFKLQQSAPAVQGPWPFCFFVQIGASGPLSATVPLEEDDDEPPDDEPELVDPDELPPLDDPPEEEEEPPLEDPLPEDVEPLAPPSPAVSPSSIGVSRFAMVAHAQRLAHSTTPKARPKCIPGSI